MELVNELLMKIFVDHFSITSIFFGLLTLILISNSFFKIKFPFFFVLSVWYLIISLTVSVCVFWLFNFFSHEQGLDRLANIPLLLGISPLFLYFLISIFLYPNKTL